MLKLSRILTSSLISAMLLAGLPLAHATTLGGSLTTDDAGYVYLSTSRSSLGTLIATESTGWTTPVSFSNVGLAPGQTYYLNIELINEGGPGGALGQFSLNNTGASFSNGTQSLLTNTSDWVGGYNGSVGSVASYSVAPRPWVQPLSSTTSFGFNGVAPWHTIAGISSSAQWIWSADSQSLPTSGTPCTYCMIDLSSTPITVASSSLGAAVDAPNAIAVLALGVLGLLALKRRSLTV